MARIAPTQVQEGGSWDGPYTPIPFHQTSAGSPHCCEIAHAILIGAAGPGQGKVLLIQSNGDRWLWDPAAPNSVSGETPCDNFVDDLFCAGHSVDKHGNIVTHGGNRKSVVAPCPSQPRYSYVFDTSTMCWSGSQPLVVPATNPAGIDPACLQGTNTVEQCAARLGFWYPSSLRLPDGRIISLGGGSSPLTTSSIPNTCGDVGNTFYNDGWQIFDPAQGGWYAKSSPIAWFDSGPNPGSGTIAPPGWYMLFVTAQDAPDTWRIPSIAKFVKLL